METTEQFFLKYAFPCAHVLLQVGEMTKEQYEELEKGAKEGKPPSRETMETSFPAAFRRIKHLAKEMNIQDHWDIRVMKEYWHNSHNRNIEQGEGSYSKFPETFCDFCKTHIAEVLQILPEGFLLIKYNETTRPVLGEYISDAKVGDKIRIHHAYAVEKLTD